MKAIFLFFMFLLGGIAATSAQGQISFNNTPPIPDAPVFDVDGITRLEGPRYRAQFWGGSSEDSLAPLGLSVPFLTGEGTGYFVGATITIPSVPSGGLAFAKVVAWDTSSGASYQEAAIRGESLIFTVLLDDFGIRPPAILRGLQSFSLIPEPGSGLLFLAGAAGFLFFRGWIGKARR
jgi:hypothetical protein